MCEESVNKFPWHAVYGETLLNLLKRAHQGEDPDLLYMEFYASAEERQDYDFREQDEE